MINLTWEDIGEHLNKGDLEEWLKEERVKDKARQLSEQADTPQDERSEWTATANHFYGREGESK